MSLTADSLDQRNEMKRWLQDHCATPHEFQFWWEFYDDLDDCFDDLEPWRLYGEGYLENERRRMRGQPELYLAAVGGGYIYLDTQGQARPEFSSRR